MERMILIGAGEGCVDIVREAFKEYDYDDNVDVIDIVIDSDELHNTLFEDRFHIKNFDDMINMEFDKLCICAKAKITREVEKSICNGRGIPAEVCVSYLQPRAGVHHV